MISRTEPHGLASSNLMLILNPRPRMTPRSFSGQLAGWLAVAAMRAAACSPQGRPVTSQLVFIGVSRSRAVVSGKGHPHHRGQRCAPPTPAAREQRLPFSLGEVRGHLSHSCFILRSESQSGERYIRLVKSAEEEFGKKKMIDGNSSNNSRTKVIDFCLASLEASDWRRQSQSYQYQSHLLFIYFQNIVQSR